MVRYFGSREEAQKHMIPEHESSTSSAFWLGIYGVIALPLVIAMLLCSSLVFEGHSATQIVDFGSKLMGNVWLLMLYVAGTVLLYSKCYAATEVQVRVSSVAKRLLQSFVAIPVWILNLFVATNPRDGGRHLDSFDYRLWTEWCLIASFVLSAMGILVYYEIVVPPQWGRKRVVAPSGDSTESPTAVADGEELETSTAVDV